MLWFDYKAILYTIFSFLGPAFTAGMTVGAAVMAIHLGWKFIKSFSS
jgi:hypothetical protein